MTRSRRRKLARANARRRVSLCAAASPVAVSATRRRAGGLCRQAPGRQPAERGGALQEVVVTAQKRTENLQTVPISVQVIDTQKLEQLNIVNLDDYVKYAPSVSYQRSVGSGEGGNAEPGSSHIYIRGVVSGGDGNHSGSQPTVGTYLDEHAGDDHRRHASTCTSTTCSASRCWKGHRARCSARARSPAPSASSPTSPIRTKFSAGYDATGTDILDHGKGYELQGFVNIPLASWAAVRLVGWIEQDAGYISNVAGHRRQRVASSTACAPSRRGRVSRRGSWHLGTGLGTVAPCPTPTTIGAGSITNAPWASSNYNTAIYRGGRGALKLDVGDNWTVTPGIMAQDLTTRGFFGYDPTVGDLELAHFGPESTRDSWYLTSLTVEGKYSDFDIVNAGGYFKRTSHTVAEYSDYSEFYDRVYGSGACWIGNLERDSPSRRACAPA